VLRRGGLHFYQPDEVAHAGEERHVHEDHCEVFVNLQGEGWVEVEGTDHEFRTGDIIIIEPGESHHVRAGPEDPVVNLWIAVDFRTG
jgi:quercetin dioxygenase-like cupin family protein